MPLTPSNKQKKTGHSLVAFVVLIVLSIAMLTVWALEGSAGPLHAIRSGFSVITVPFNQLSGVITLPFQAVGDAMSNAISGQDAAGDAQDQSDELQAAIIQNQEYQQENARLNALLGLESSYGITNATAARVISRGTDSWNQTITIDKGSNDGLQVALPVMSSEGLIGQVESVGPFTSTVRLITDPTSGVSAYLQSSRAEGVVSGSADGILYMDYIPAGTNVQTGEAVLTSGSGGVYPKGIIVGTVASVSANPNDEYETITISPMAASQTYEEVIVLTGGQDELNYAPPAADATQATQTQAQATQTQAAQGQGS
ncbi:MAG: rod shape-determining protein MreC [Coriobacteriales bacterium]|jgi:rod shape-determining protein MreC|nr:rod shape-determining protein MreC [Coriobacteriales bacterium]